MDDIEFVDEPPVPYSPRRSSKFRPIVEKLVANEGQWAKVQRYEQFESARTTAYDIRGGRGSKVFQGYRWEAVAHRCEDDRSAGELYLRCLGPVE